MNKTQARAEIEKLSNLNEKKVGKLLISIELELIACGEKSKIRKSGRDIGQIDFIFKDTGVKTIFLIEVSKQEDDRAEKANYFFTRWTDSENIKLLQNKFNLPTTYKFIRIYLDLSGKDECPLNGEVVSDRKRNYWLTRNDFNYFVDVENKIGLWARSDFLGYLEIKPKELPSKKKDAIQFFLGDDLRAYSYVDTVSNLLKYCYISRRRKNDKGYQRMLDKKRIAQISKKVESGEILAFPNSILISSPDTSDLCSSPATKDDCPCYKKIHLPDFFCSCRVIDGQHRLLGFARVDPLYQEQHFIPVVLLENISQHKEMRTFIEINSGQKKIDRNLILVLQADFDWNKDTHPKEFFEKQAVQVMKKLNTQRGSPLRGKIFIPEVLESPRGKITLLTLVSKQASFIMVSCYDVGEFVWA